MKILVYGAGAIGGTVGGYMTKAGADVVLVDKVQEHVDQMNSTGLRFTGYVGDETVPVKAILPDQMTGPLELVFLAVKSQDTAAALDALISHLGPQSTVVSLQNGMNPIGIAARIGADRTVGAFVTIPCDYHGPGHIMRGKKGKIWVGELDGKMTDRIKTIRGLLSAACDAFETDNIYGYLWTKQAYGSAAAIAAMVDADTNDVFTHEKYRDLVVDAVIECVKLAEAEGVRLESIPFLPIEPFVKRSTAGREAMYKVFQDVAQEDSKNLKTRSGLWRDLWVRKRRTEVPWLTGYAVERGKALGVPTPICEATVKMISELEDGTRSIGWENLDELNQLVTGG